MLKLFLLSLRGRLRHHAVTMALSILGIALGVMVVVAMDAAVTACVRSFENAVLGVAGKTTHSIEAEKPLRGVPDSFYLALANQHPEIIKAPIIDRQVSMFKPGDDAHSVKAVAGTNAVVLARMVGVDAFADTKLRSFSDADDMMSEQAFHDWLLKPNHVAMVKPLADRLNLKVGDRINVNLGSSWEDLTIASVFELSGPLAARLDDLILADLATAQELFGLTGSGASPAGFGGKSTPAPPSIDRVDLILNEAEHALVHSFIEDYQSGTGLTGLKLNPIDAQTQQLKQLTAAYQLNLNTLSLMAMVVGVFIVYNTLLVSVFQQRKSMGVYQSVGATPGLIQRLFLLEAMLKGMLGATLGLFMGYAIADWLVGYVSGTINDLYAYLRPPAVQITSAMWIKAFAVGLSTSLLGAIIPLWMIGKSEPVQLMQRAYMKRVKAKKHPLSKLGTSGFLFLGGLLLVGAFVLAGMTVGILGAFAVALCCALGFACLSPAVTGLVSRLVMWLGQRLRFITWRLAATEVKANLHVTGTTVAAMMLAMAMSVALLTMISSFRGTVSSWLDQRFRADVFIGPRITLESRVAAQLNDEVLPWVQGQPETQTVFAYRQSNIELNHQGKVLPAFLDATNVVKLLAAESMPLVTKASGDFDPMRDLLLSEPLSGKLNLDVGDTFNLPTSLTGLNEPLPLRVHAIYYDFAADRGKLLLDEALLKSFKRTYELNSLHVKFNPDVDVFSAIDRWRDALAGRFPISVYSHKHIKSESLRIFDRTFRITKVLSWLAGMVAICGMIGGLISLILPKRKLFATIRTMGLSRGQMFSWILGEGIIIGVSSAILSMAAGLCLAYVLANLIQYRSFGWSIPVSPNSRYLIEAVVYGIGAAFIASLYPMRELLRRPLSENLSVEGG